MFILISAVLLLGLDSFVVSFALGMCRVERPLQNRLGASFGLWDALASLVGLWVGVSYKGYLITLGRWGGEALIGLYAVFALATACLGRSIANSGWHRRTPLLYALPFAMSLDTLTASFALTHAARPAGCAFVLAVASALESIGGFRLGEMAADGLKHLTARRAMWFADAYLVGVILVATAIVLAVL